MKFTFGSILKFAGALAVGVLILGQAPLAQATPPPFAPTMLLCVSDFASASSCVSGTGGGSNFVLLESDGVTVQTVNSGGTFDVISDSTTFGNSIQANICLGAAVANCAGGELVTFDTGTRSYTTSPYSDLHYGETTTGASTVNIWWGVTGYTGGAPFTGAIGGTNGAGSTTSWIACIENSTASDPGADIVCPSGSDAVTINSGSSSALSFNSSASSGALNTTTPFGLQQQIKIVTTGATTTTGDYSLVPAPEPTSILLFGGAALLAFGAIRRKMQLS